jgi:hypothetical protein
MKAIVLGSYGYPFVLEIYHPDSDPTTDPAEDISSYTTIQVEIKDPSGNIATETAAFFTDGTDGKVKYTTVLNDIDEIGNWNIRAKVSVSGLIVMYSTWLGFPVTD